MGCAKIVAGCGVVDMRGVQRFLAGSGAVVDSKLPLLCVGGMGNSWCVHALCAGTSVSRRVPCIFVSSFITPTLGSLARSAVCT